MTSLSTQSNFELLAEYNQWINNSLYESASKLTANQLSEDRGAFFGSILVTLNHILIGDIFWLKRFAEHPAAFESLSYVRGLSHPRALNELLYEDIEQLKKARAKMDSVIIDFSHELTNELLATSLSYVNTKGDAFTKNFGHLLVHFFNHQAHHRGQISVLLNQLGIEVGVTDLVVRIPNV